MESRVALAQKPVTRKFFVKNLDCAACAAKLEKHLNQTDGIGDAVIDFANLTLHVSADDDHPVVEAVRRVDPHIELISHSTSADAGSRDPAQESLDLKREIAVLVAASALFGWQLFFEESSYSNPLGSWGLVVVAAAYLLAGWNVLGGALRTLRNGMLFDENVLMAIATAGAIAIGAYAEAVGVMIFYKVGELLQNLSVARSRRSIRALLSAKPDRAWLKTSAGLTPVPPEAVSVGDTIVVKPGEKIPLDGTIVEGSSRLDTSALTGEPVPVSAKADDTVMAGQISINGALTIAVTRPFEESSIAKVMELVENATARKAKTEAFITTFARYYTPAVVAIAALIALVPPLLAGADFQLWLYRALVILVISCPCALVVSIPLGYFGGIGRASKEGILVKGSNFIDALAAVKRVIFDKTGTLTRGVFHVNHVVNLNGFSQEKLLEFAAAAEYQSNHPIAASILTAYRQRHGDLPTERITGHRDMAGQGVAANYDGHTVFVGNDHMLHLKNIAHQACQFDSTVAHIAVDGKYAGYISIGDRLRSDAQSAVSELRAQGVARVSMLTGDNRCAAEAVSRAIGLDDFQSDLLPEEKVRVVEQLAAQHSDDGKIAFVGDGINDAPVIARADVGIAMGGLGSDAAVESADVVLVNDSPTKVARAISIARATRRIVWQNIVLAFAIKGIFITFGAMGLATMWEAVFADMGTALVAVANSTRILRSK
jgi:Cd2+/Zn2+-exporting ATPase